MSFVKEKKHGVLFSPCAELVGGETDSVVESLTDTDSVKGLGETSDFLNMVRDPHRFHTAAQQQQQRSDDMLLILFYSCW